MQLGEPTGWQELCEFLDNQPGKSAAKTTIPEHLVHLLSDRYRRERKQLDIVYYARGWGWRLRHGWNDRLSSSNHNVD